MYVLNPLPEVNKQEVLKDFVYQGFSIFWFYGAHEEIDHNLRSPTINF